MEEEARIFEFRESENGFYHQLFINGVGKPYYIFIPLTNQLIEKLVTQIIETEEQLGELIY